MARTGEFCRAQFNVTKNSAQRANAQRLVAMDRNRSVGVATGQYVMTSADADHGETQ
jgi:hypothetical protein